MQMSNKAYKALTEDVPQLKRNRVWCVTCGRSQGVDSAECMRTGWPLCCEQTMTIDSPEERERMR